MNLLELVIEPSGAAGWGSKVLKFGSDITQLYGPNGCGKTPVIHSIAYAIGYPVKFRDDILANCKSVVLRAIHNEKEIVFRREYSESFHIECVVSDSKDVRVFYNEQEFSDFLFEFLGIEVATLTSVRSEPSRPYVSTYLPLFYVDQDSGYKDIYKSPSSFIRDQYAEMVRMALSVPAKNSFERKRILIEKKDRLKSLDVSIVSQERFVERLTKDRTGSTKSHSQLIESLQGIQRELDELRSSQDATEGIDSALNYLIGEKSQEKKSLDIEIRNLEERIVGFQKIQHEIEIEINTLSLNEEAKRLFTSFKDICSNAECQLFFTSSESYAKNLLYLRDQIKDLDRNTEHHRSRVEELKQKSDSLNAEIRSLKNDLSMEEKGGSTDDLIVTISNLTRSMIDIQGEIEIAERLETEKNKYVELLNDRERLHDDIASIDSRSSGTDLRLLEFRTAYRDRIKDWLDVLCTRNVSRAISVDSDFTVLFGSEKVSQFSGSTLLRVVLAMKAAFFDVYISSGFNQINFMIFDTPRQQDIEAEHFAAFVSRLKEVASGSTCQIVFSTTEYHYDSQDNDVEWVPSFSGEEQNMFLGVS